MRAEEGRPVTLEGSEFAIEADSIIMAIGQKTDFSFVKNKAVNKWGMFDTKETATKQLQTQEFLLPEIVTKGLILPFVQLQMQERPHSQ
ncbi:hypothetical protein [Candidatus Kuenenia stuttgartiensis]|uniref:hypothetical protein n=1 Tax=Kuenenia stuttgartiensis TaxID=174633 RepID=UPI00146E41D1|nr:hypothetical protein [Candidatus Kuenenia stuttgartiensis]